MKKKLKIKFWKTEKALAMQIVEQEGLPKEKLEGKVCIMDSPDLFKNRTLIYLRGDDIRYNDYVASVLFETNQERDKYLDKMTQAITDELFTGTGELKVGEYCRVGSCPSGCWRKKKLIAILPDNYRSRFITQCDEDANNWFGYEYAQPINKRTEPKVEECGEVITYTWEE